MEAGLVAGGGMKIATDKIGELGWSTPREDSRMQNGFPRRIMLVEDDPDIQMIARMALECVGGFTVALSDSGDQALETAPLFGPDLILMDVMMPGMDGPTVLQVLRGRKETAGTPVIFMTAKVQNREVAQYREMGALGVIPKPFDPMGLPGVIRKIWEESR
jgi:CheY-like chemotaxis protein